MSANFELPSLRGLPAGMALFALGITGAAFFRLRRQQRRTQISELLTYVQVVDYFVQNRPASEEHLRGALLRQKRSRSWLVTFRFLDEAGEVCLEAGKEHGRQVLVRDMDEELAEVFGDKDLVLFE